MPEKNIYLCKTERQISQTNSRTCSHMWCSSNRAMPSSSNKAAIMKILGKLALELHIPLTVFTNGRSLPIRDGFHVYKQREISQNLVLIKADNETFTQKLCYSCSLWQYHCREGCCGPYSSGFGSHKISDVFYPILWILHEKCRGCHRNTSSIISLRFWQINFLHVGVSTAAFYDLFPSFIGNSMFHHQCLFSSNTHYFVHCTWNNTTNLKLSLWLFITHNSERGRHLGRSFFILFFFSFKFCFFQP